MVALFFNVLENKITMLVYIYSKLLNESNYFTSFAVGYTAANNMINETRCP